MADQNEQVRLTFRDVDNRSIGELIIFGKPDTIVILDPSEATDFNEEKVQLIEGRTYEYMLFNFDINLRLRNNQVLSNSSFSTPTEICGYIKPESYTGLLTLILEDQHGNSMGYVGIEVRSKKISYRTDYRIMLEEICEKCSDLLLDLRSPTSIRLIPDPGRHPETIQQRFEFLKSLLQSKDFNDALHRILSLPHRSLKDEFCRNDIRKSIKNSGSALKQIAQAGSARVPLPVSHPLYKRMRGLGVENPSVPNYINMVRKQETIDTPENRFVKYALETFIDLLTKIEKVLMSRQSSSNRRFLNEVITLRNNLAEVLSKDFFKSISEPNVLPLGSPVLQKKTGYREILQAWLKFNLAANLIWAGGDDVYGGGKKNLSALYEYWLFFILLDLMVRKFGIPEATYQSIIEQNADGFGLKLKAGKKLYLQGRFKNGDTFLRTKFNYNCSFAVTNDRFAEGSWTLNMRPDFTISFWPDLLSEEEARTNNLLTHLHFDAKYKMDRLESIFVNMNLDDLDEEEGKGIYKRGDILKMHAYHDAIHRSDGAYVLYPGDENLIRKASQNLLPSIGAFAIRPGQGTQGSDYLSGFLSEVINHLCERFNSLLH